MPLRYSLYLTALAGFAPYNKDSGNIEGKRSIYGRRSLKEGLAFYSHLFACLRNKHAKPLWPLWPLWSNCLKRNFTKTTHIFFCMSLFVR